MGSSGSKPKQEQEPEPEPEPERKRKLPPTPPLFPSPPGIAHTSRMLVPAYERAFGKLLRRRMFEDYFNPAGGVSAGVRLKPPPQEDPSYNANLTANISASGAEAMLRWQSDSSDDPSCILDFLVSSTTKPMLQLRSYASFAALGAFGSIPLGENGKILDDRGVMGLRYDTGNLSAGASFVPFPSSSDGGVPSKIPYNSAWLVGRIGGLTAGVQYKPLGGSKHSISFQDLDLKNWNWGISYGTSSTNPLDPLFNVSLELVRSTQLVASFYHHQVYNKYDPSYIDLGLEVSTRLDKNNPTDSTTTDNNSLFQIAACWQLFDALLLKGKIGPSKSSIALAVMPNSLFTFSFTAVNDHSNGTRAYGFGIHADDLNLNS